MTRFEKIYITEEQRNTYFSARQRGLLKREDMHVFAMFEDDSLMSMAMISKDHTYDETYVIHDLYLKEDADARYLTELVAKVEETCQSVGANYMTCRLQGDKEQTATCADLLLSQEYHFVEGGYKLIYALEELVDCRLMESAENIRNLMKYVKPYRMLTREQKADLVAKLEKSQAFRLADAPDPEFCLVVIVKGDIVAYMDARKLNESVITIPPVSLWKHEYTIYARALLMIYVIEKAQQTMQADTVLAFETFTDAVYQQCFDWFGLPEVEENIIEMIKVI